MTWAEVPPPPAPRLGPRDWLRVARRAGPMALLVFGGLAVLLACRPFEALLHGAHRPWTPRITRAVCRGALRLMGLRRTVEGTPRPVAAWVANHASWLDIFALNAGGTIVFVAKSEVARWPGIGWLARATGTVFVTRDRRRALQDVAALRERIALGQTLAFFPEGTSTDGRRVLAFKPTLLAPFLGLDAAIQPVTLRYIAPEGADPACYGWWGDMDFAPHMLATLALPRQGRIALTFHPPVPLAAETDRKALARRLEQTVRAGL